MVTPKHEAPKIPGVLDILKSQNVLFTIITLVLCIMSFYVGALSTELRFYKNGGMPNANNKAAQPTGPAAPQDMPDLPKPSASDHKRGSQDPKIALIEYSDFDCPYCASFHTTAAQALDNNADLVWIYRHFPLTIHPEAMNKAMASECVAKISNDENFWKLADIFFARKPTLAGLPDVVATELGISKDAYTSCLNNKETEQRVLSDMSAASKIGVDGTPASFVMNIETGKVVPIPGAQSYSYVQQAIDSLK